MITLSPNGNILSVISIVPVSSQKNSQNKQVFGRLGRRDLSSSLWRRDAPSFGSPGLLHTDERVPLSRSENENGTFRGRICSVRKNSAFLKNVYVGELPGCGEMSDRQHLRCYIFHQSVMLSEFQEFVVLTLLLSAPSTSTSDSDFPYFPATTITS